MTCELGDLDSDIAFPARSLAKQVVDNVLCVSGRDAAAGEEGKQAVCRVAVTGDIVDENRLVGNAEEVLLGLDDKHGIDGAQVFFGIGKRGVGGGDQLILHRETGAVGADEQRIALPRALARLSVLCFGIRSFTETVMFIFASLSVASGAAALHITAWTCRCRQSAFRRAYLRRCFEYRCPDRGYPALRWLKKRWFRS